MTNESESQTLPFIEGTGASYAYAFDKGGKLARYFGVSGIPHAILVDPTGKVVWRGHPAGLDDKTIQEHLGGALTKPLYDWPASAKAAAHALTRADFAGALDKAGKVPEAEGGADIVAQIQGFIETRLKSAESALEDGNFYGAKEQGEELVKGLKGLPEAERAQRVLDGVEASPDSKDVISAQEKIHKIQARGPSKRKEIERAMDDMKDIVKELPGTYAAKEATAYMDQLRDLLRK